MKIAIIAALCIAAGCTPGNNRFEFAKRCEAAGGVPVVPTDRGGICLEKSAVMVLPKK